MADNSLTVSHLINYHAESLEEQTHYFGMINSLTQVALDGVFLEQPKLILHYYLCVVSKLIETTAGINEASLALLRQYIESQRITD